MLFEQEEMNSARILVLGEANTRVAVVNTNIKMEKENEKENENENEPFFGSSKKILKDEPFFGSFKKIQFLTSCKP